MPTMLLPIDLTEAERLLVLSDLSTKLTALEALTEEKKAIPERIKSLMGAINHLNHSIATNTVEREVEVHEEPNAFGGTVKIFRVDTGAFVRERAMDPGERQLRLGDTPVPGPTPDNVRSLAEAREKTEEQLAAGTPEEAEALRDARLADDRARRLEETLAGLTVIVIDREDGHFLAHVEGKVPGVAGESGLSGPIRDTAEAARAELLDEIRRLAQGSTTWDDVAAASAEAQRQAEIDKLAADQAADAEKDKPKGGLQVPKGAKGRRTKPAKEEANGVDTTPPPGGDF